MFIVIAWQMPCKVLTCLHCHLPCVLLRALIQWYSGASDDKPPQGHANVLL